MLVLCVFWWLKNRDKPYLKVRSTAAMMLTSTGYFAGLIALPLQRWSLDNNSFLNSCATIVVLLVISLSLAIFGTMLRYWIVFVKRQLLEKLVEEFAMGRQHFSKQPRNDKTVDATAEKYMYRSSEEFTWKLSGLIVILTLGVSFFSAAITCPQFKLVDCNFSRLFKIFAGLGVTWWLSIVFFFTYLKYKTKDYPDPFGLQAEVLYSMITVTICTPLAIVTMLLYPVEENDESAKTYQFDYLTSLDLFLNLYFFYLIPYQVYKARKYAKGSSDYGALKLLDILNHPVGRKLFQQHLISEWNAPNLSFWLAFQSWKKNYFSISQDVRETMARNIYRVYFTEQSATELNVSYTARIELKEMIEGDMKYALILFDAVGREVYDLMEQDIFFRFKITERYRLYMGLEPKNQ